MPLIIKYTVLCNILIIRCSWVLWIVENNIEGSTPAGNSSLRRPRLRLLPRSPSRGVTTIMVVQSSLPSHAHDSSPRDQAELTMVYCWRAIAALLLSTGKCTRPKVCPVILDQQPQAEASASASSYGFLRP